jgi:malate permease and related proteins
VLDTLLRALTLVAIIGIGQLAKRLGWVSTSDFSKFSKIVLGVTLPCALFTSFNSFHVEFALLSLAIFGLVVNFALQVIGYLQTRRRSRQDQAFAVFNSGSYNIGAFSTPYLSGLIGPHAMIYSSLFDIGTAIASAGIAYGWGMSLAHESGRMRFGRIVRTVATNPVFVTYLTLLVMQLLSLRLPDQLIVFTSTVGAANPFLAMLMIGIGLDLRLSRSKYLDAARLLARRYLFGIVVAVGSWYLLPLPVEARLVVVMLLFAPIAAMVPAFCAEADLDVELASFANSVSVLVAILTMPTIYLILG